jgi:hypothetical protein
VPTAIILDEFQEVLGLDEDYLKLFRAVFQRQQHVAHVYLGSDSRLMGRIFLERDEPFFRHARLVTLERIALNWFAAFLAGRFSATGKSISHEAIVELLAITRGHPYQTQELGSYAWVRTQRGATAGPGEIRGALEEAVAAGDPLYSMQWAELSRGARRVLLALAVEPGVTLYGREAQLRHALSGHSATQHAITQLERRDLIERSAEAGGRASFTISDSVFRAWLRRNNDDEPLLPIGERERELASDAIAAPTES